MRTQLRIIPVLVAVAVLVGGCKKKGEEQEIKNNPAGTPVVQEQKDTSVGKEGVCLDKKLPPQKEKCVVKENGGLPCEKRSLVSPTSFNAKKETQEEQIERRFSIAIVNGVGSKWSSQELQLLKNTLENLPEIFHGKQALHSISREKVSMNEQGIKDPNAAAIYCFLERRIRFYDAVNPRRNPSGELKASMIHGLTHPVLHTNSKTGDEYADSWKNPLVKEYAKLTGWKSGKNLDFEGDLTKIPTVRGRLNVGEDLCESAQLYVMAPKRLKKISTERYDFLKARIFNGREY